MATNTLKCPLCESLSLSFKLYVSHLRVVHSKDPSFNIMCGVDGCREVFRAFSAFNSHVYRHHRAVVGVNVDQPPLESSQNQVPGPPFPADTVLEPEHDLMDNDQEGDQVCLTGGSTVVRKADSHEYLQTVTAAKFLLQLREGRQISQVAISDVTTGCKSLCKQAVDRVKEDVTAKLASAGINCDSVPGLVDVLNNDPDPFQCIDSNYRFEKFCVEHLGCLEAKEIPFGESYYVNQFSGHKRRKVSHTDKFYYIPILQSLKNLLELDDFQAEVMNPHAQVSDDYLGDFCDGTSFKTHPLFSSDPFALQVIGYYDELEIVNPIGSYIKKHKLGCMFFFLANVRPQFRSTFKAIHLVAVAKHQDIVKYGIDKFLTPFVEDLKDLYCDGITVSFGGEERTIYGALLAFLADTLAAHLVGGFKESMSFSLRICRSCMITLPQVKKCLVESSCLLRTPATHFEQCSLLLGPLHEHYSTSFGIKRLSKLEEVPSFSVINGVPHDIMHDLYEGVVPYELKLLLRHCVHAKYFTIEELNERIEGYDFGSNSPVPIDPKLLSKPNKIRQSASQMMALSRELPLLIADTIAHDDQHWHSFLILLKICSIAVSPLCTHDTIAYLRILIEEKLFLFQQLYPEESMTPKLHYMVHYPSQIERLGPLIHSWNMRQEAKLSFVKRVSRRSNYKNVAKTVAKKHQFWLCHQIQADSHLLTPRFESSKKVLSNPLSEEDNYIQTELLRLIPHLALDSIVEHPSWVNLQSSHLCKGVYVLLNYNLMRPVFGKVIDIVTIEQTVVLCVLKYYGHTFHAHYNCYEIGNCGAIVAVSAHVLADHRPLHARTTFVSSDKSLYIVLPYIY